MNSNLAALSNCLSEIDNKFERVNKGGCAVVASFIGESLRTVFPIMRITSSNNWGDDKINLDTVRKKLDNSLNKREWDNNGLDFKHVWVEVLVDDQWYALDSTGVKPIKDMYERWGTPAKGSFTFEEIRSLSELDDWNWMFDRSQIPEMKEFINNQLEEFANM